MASLRVSWMILAVVAFVGCAERPDVDRDARPAWRRKQATDHKMLLRDVLNGTPDVDFYDGWYAIENDPNTGGAWRWMGKRGVVRFRTHPGADEAVDVELQIHGWAPVEHVGFRTCHMEFAVNGHVLDRFEPPKGTFVRTIFVPRFLLASSEWVDLAISVANTARPTGEWRDLGFATTGFIWRPLGKS